MKTPQGYLLRFMKGDEVMGTLSTFCKDNDIRAAQISAIGALTHAELGFYDLTEKQYFWKTFEGDFELVSASGNVSVFEGETVLHVHVVISDRAYKPYGGHLRKGVVGATCEMILTPHEAALERKFDENIGLNLWGFD